MHGMSVSDMSDIHGGAGTFDSSFAHSLFDNECQFLSIFYIFTGKEFRGEHC